MIEKGVMPFCACGNIKERIEYGQSGRKCRETEEIYH